MFTTSFRRHLLAFRPRRAPATRAVPALAPGASHSGTVTVTIPKRTPPRTSSVLACADNASTVAETDEKNSCTTSATTVTVTP